jgi:hypothetical protein
MLTLGKMFSMTFPLSPPFTIAPVATYNFSASSLKTINPVGFNTRKCVLLMLHWRQRALCSCSPLHGVGRNLINWYVVRFLWLFWLDVCF